MPRTTPFHARTEPHNQTGIWKHWSGYLVAPQYQYSLSNEYYAIRNSVSLLDTSPLFKYRFRGDDGLRVLERALTRNPGTVQVGRAQYTCWCDERGFLRQDGVLLHVAEGEYRLTAAEPALKYFRDSARELGVDTCAVEDISDAFGILALQGPHAHDVMVRLTDAATPLRYFRLAGAEIAGCEVTVSRTGYTGDLGYEVWVNAADAGTVWDALMEAGADYNVTPIGTTAMKMARVEAGLLLIGVDFHSSRHAWTDEQRETPLELGWDWMFRKLADDDRDFVGRSAIEAELADGTSRWKTVGLGVDGSDYDRVYTEAGVVPPRHELYREATMSLYRRGGKAWDYAGYASSFLTSSLLQRPIAIAKMPLELTEPGAEVDIEVTVVRKPDYVLARVERLPFFDPERKIAAMGGDA